MGKHDNPLQKEFLILRHKNNMGKKLADFCDANGVSITAFKKWLRLYEEGGLEGLAGADTSIQEVLPEGVDRSVESYKREIIKLRIENERKKTILSGRTRLGIGSTFA